VIFFWREEVFSGFSQFEKETQRLWQTKVIFFWREEVFSGFAEAWSKRVPYTAAAFSVLQSAKLKTRNEL